MLEPIRQAWQQAADSGEWKPAPGDVLSECDFIKAGFRAYGLEDSDHRWRLTLSRLDFGDSNPSALLEVHAPQHDAAFGDLGWFVFSHSIGTNGGTNFNQAIKRLSITLGGNEADWSRRITYLIKRAKEANVGAGNGTFSTTSRPRLRATPEFVFDGRIREGRTMSLFGPGSAGKTTIADGLIASACSGTEVIPGWRPTRRYTTLILDWDEGEEEETIRLAAICDAYDIELGSESSTGIIGGYHYKRQTRPLHDVADEIGAYIVRNKIELLVISPMGRASRSFGENITAPVDEIYEILRSFGTTNILIDHVTGDKMAGGATREFGSVRKRDNARGSYAVDVQSEEPGTRVLVLRNTKADALAPRQGDQAVRVEYDPPWPKGDGSYDRITFHADQVIANPQMFGPYEGIPLKERIREALAREGHMTAEELADDIGANAPSIRTILNRYKNLFSRLPSGKWENLP